MNTVIPEDYRILLGMYDTQKAISLLHRLFEDRLGALLNLYRVSAPLFVEENSGLNDNLNGYERPVCFEILRSNHKAQVVQSLAKWKRLALKRYGFFPGKGLYTDMNAIRRDEDELDNLHSVYVDQWDWEKVILPENRNEDYLKLTVMDIVRAISSLHISAAPDTGKTEQRCLFRDNAGAGRPVSGSLPERERKHLAEGTQNRFYYEDRREAEIREKTRRKST